MIHTDIIVAVEVSKYCCIGCLLFCEALLQVLLTALQLSHTAIETMLNYFNCRLNTHTHTHTHTHTYTHTHTHEYLHQLRMKTANLSGFLHEVFFQTSLGFQFLHVILQMCYLFIQLLSVYQTIGVLYTCSIQTVICWLVGDKCSLHSSLSLCFSSLQPTVFSTHSLSYDTSPL